MRAEIDEGVEAAMKEYQEDDRFCNEEAVSSSKQTSTVHDVCEVLLDQAQQTVKKQPERMLSIIQYKRFYLPRFRTKVNTLRGCEDMLKRGANKSSIKEYLKSILLKWKNTVII